MSITKISAAMADLDGAVTINNSGADADFIVESDGSANAIFVNAGDDRVTFFNSTTVNAASGTDDGASHYSDGRTDISRASGQPLNLRRRTDDGIVTNFFKEASGTVTDVGAISTWSSNLAVGRQNCALLFDDDVNRIKPASVTSSGARDNVIDLGDPSHRFNDVWIGGGIHIGGTGDANKLDDYEEGTWTPVIKAVSGTSSISFTNNQAGYTKIGRLVLVQGYFSNIDMTDLTSGTYVVVTGLPYTPAAYADFHIGYHRGGDHFTGGYLQSGSDMVFFVDSSGVEIEQGGNHTMTAFMFNVTYITS